MSGFLNTQPEYYSSLEQLRGDKRRLGKQIRKSMRTIQDGAKQCFLPDAQIANSSNKYVRFIGYGLTAWKTAKVVSKVMKLFKK